eukprot:480964-Hanusia_phi.AAC.1
MGLTGVPAVAVGGSNNLTAAAGGSRTRSAVSSTRSLPSCESDLSAAEYRTAAVRPQRRPGPGPEGAWRGARAAT